MQGNNFRSRLVPLGAACAVMLALSACQARVDHRGYLPDADEVARIKPGLQGRDEVRDILGTPSSTSTFTSDRWYYISKKTSQKAFFDPKVLEQHVLEIDFDSDGLVQEVRNYSLQDGEKIQPVARVTPSPGRELTFTEQLIGNIGKFNSPAGSTTGNPNRPGPGY
jgi:outer membrane protein assembly factor BamE (lipoprotein component of BamABCDE complex)